MDTSTLDLESTNGQASSYIIPPGGTFQYYPPYFWNQQVPGTLMYQTIPPPHIIPTGQPLAYPIYTNNFYPQEIIEPGHNTNFGYSWSHGLPYQNIMMSHPVPGNYGNGFSVPPQGESNFIAQEQGLSGGDYSCPTQALEYPNTLEPISNAENMNDELPIQDESQFQIQARAQENKLKRYQMKSSYCTLCKCNGEKEDFYMSHTLKDESGKTLCPVLRALLCPICGATGDNSHTRKYCPENMDPINSASGFQYKKRFNSTFSKITVRYH